MKEIHNKYSKDKEQYIVDQYTHEGLDTVQIAKKLGTYNTTIRRILIRNNVNLIPTSERLRKVKHNPFEDLTSKDVQYWIGYLAADGNISRSLIRLHSKDKIVLDQFKLFLNSEVNILEERKLYTNYVGYVIGFNNKCAGLSLNSVGILPNKSLSFSVNIPITWSFIRGIFDGDGSLIIDKRNGHKRFSIFTASVVFANQLNSFFISEGLTSYIKEDNRDFRNNTLYSVSIYKQSELQRCYELLYKDATYFLPRKYSRFGSTYDENHKAKKTAKTGKVRQLIPC